MSTSKLIKPASWKIAVCDKDTAINIDVGMYMKINYTNMNGETYTVKAVCIDKCTDPLDKNTQIRANTGEFLKYRFAIIGIKEKFNLMKNTIVDIDKIIYDGLPQNLKDTIIPTKIPLLGSEYSNSIHLSTRFDFLSSSDTNIYLSGSGNEAYDAETGKFITVDKNSDLSVIPTFAVKAYCDNYSVISHVTNGSFNPYKYTNENFSVITEYTFNVSLPIKNMTVFAKEGLYLNDRKYLCASNVITQNDIDSGYMIPKPIGSVTISNEPITSGIYIIRVISLKNASCHGSGMKRIELFKLNDNAYTCIGSANIRQSVSATMFKCSNDFSNKYITLQNVDVIYSTDEIAPDITSGMIDCIYSSDTNEYKSLRLDEFNKLPINNRYKVIYYVVGNQNQTLYHEQSLDSSGNDYYLNIDLVKSGSDIFITILANEADANISLTKYIGKPIAIVIDDANGLVRICTSDNQYKIRTNHTNFHLYSGSFTYVFNATNGYSCIDDIGYANGRMEIYFNDFNIPYVYTATKHFRFSFKSFNDTDISWYDLSMLNNAGQLSTNDDNDTLLIDNIEIETIGNDKLLQLTIDSVSHNIFASLMDIYKIGDSVKTIWVTDPITFFGKCTALDAVNHLTTINNAISLSGVADHGYMTNCTYFLDESLIMQYAKKDRIRYVDGVAVEYLISSGSSYKKVTVTGEISSIDETIDELYFPIQFII